jgi:hypothetical protein
LPPRPNCLARKNIPYLAPTIGVFTEAEVVDASIARLIVWAWTGGAIENTQFLEVGQNREYNLGAPSIAVKLVR